MAVHGTAGMKALQSTLGSRLLPVPSLLLSGLTNIPGAIKITIDFKRLLLSAFELAKNQEFRVHLYIGYLGEPHQVDDILEAIDTYRAIIGQIIVDPVSGDHGRLYVAPPIVAQWPRLLSIANWALPNFTELQLYSGLDDPGIINFDIHREAFEKKYPDLNYIITGIPGDNDLEVFAKERTNGIFHHVHHEILNNYGGSGDIFGAEWVKNYLFNEASFGYAVDRAVEKILYTIRFSEQNNSPGELLLYPD